VHTNHAELDLPGGRVVRVVVADDDGVSRMLLQGAVEQLGHSCQVAVDGIQAWEMVNSDQPDVLITDQMMPGMDGLELCRRVRQLSSSRYTYIVVATSLRDHSDVRAGMQAGADDFLTKPVEPFDLEIRMIAASRVTALHVELDRYRDELARLATIDPMTQLLNRRALDRRLADLHAHSERHSHPYTLAMCDIDLFKSYNDNFGHQAGDRALQQVAATLHNLRAGDLVFRYGGEEFLILCPDQDLRSGLAAANRIRTSIGRLAIPRPDTDPASVLTISVGVAAYDPINPRTSAELLKAADDALYDAKAAGRNVVSTGYPAIPVPPVTG
jgi:diguanylate cyclase (GGDEF)-like protein